MSKIGRKTNDDIDLGLAVLSAIRAPGEILSFDAMAAACNCTKTAIDRIEKKAMRKLAHRLRFTATPAVREAVAAILHRDL